MTTATDPVAPLRKHLERGTAPDLAVAFQRMPEFCRRFFRLDRLLELFLKEQQILWATPALEALRNEIVRRFLVTADRGRWRPRFLEFLQAAAAGSDPLHAFVDGQYHPRVAGRFAQAERDYLDRLRATLDARTRFADPVYDALAWLGAAPGGDPAPSFRILFANEEMHRRFQDVMTPGLCVGFSFAPANSSEPFARCDLERLGMSFRRAAVDSEIRAYELCGKEFGTNKHRRIRIEDSLEGLSLLDGTSGYLTLLMTHLCLLRGEGLSRYVGFTGTHQDFRRLAAVHGLPEKLLTAIDSGLRVVFIPKSNADALDPRDRPPEEILRLISYDERLGLAEVTEGILEELRGLKATLLPDGGDPAILPPAAVPGRPVTRPLQEKFASAEPLGEPEKLFSTLRCFSECGGYRDEDFPPRLSVFNPTDDSFVSLFPGKRRLYRFDTLGTLCEKCKSVAIPLAALWNEEQQEYVIGFADGHIQRYDGSLKPTRGFPLPAGIEPRILACDGETLFAADRRSPHVVAVTLSGRVLGCRTLPGKISQLAFSEKRGQLAVGYEKGVAILAPALTVQWQAEHEAPETAVACTSTGEVWAGLSTGRLWKLSAANQRSVDVGSPGGLRSLAVIEEGVVAGTLGGTVSLYDPDGSLLGADDLGAALYHLCATEGGLLVLSTARGVTVVKPDPRVAAAARDEKLRDASAKLAAWEQAVEDPTYLGRLIRAYLQRIDLARWQDVIAFQSAFLRRKAVETTRYARIEEMMRLADARKSARLCARTRPAIIDGSNVSRHHWNIDTRPNRRSRLSTIIKVRDALLKESAPLLYPVVIVVDVTERHTSDDPAALKRMIGQGEVLETPSKREADALIFTLVQTHDWSDCQIVTNDNRMFEAHAHVLPGKGLEWYRKVQRPFAIHQNTGEVYFPPEESLIGPATFTPKPASADRETLTMPLCVYCDAEYPVRDAACSACGRSTRLDSDYPVICGELVLVECPGCERFSVLPRQIRCEGGCDLSGRWDSAAGSVSGQNLPRDHGAGESRPLPRGAMVPSGSSAHESLQRPAVPVPADTRDQGQGPSCPHCHARVADGDRFCDRCGKSLARTCAACGAKNKQTALWCSGCGAALSGEPEAAAPPATPPPPSLDPAIGVVGTALGSGDGSVLSRWQLVAVASDGSEVRRFELREGDNLVGSESAGEGIHPDVDLGPLDLAKNISRRHALISVQGDRLFLADHPGPGNRGSRNGTWVDGVRITSTPVEVSAHTDIAFAQLRFRVSTRT